MTISGLMAATELADELEARAVPLETILDAGKLLLERSVDRDPETLARVVGWAQRAGIPIPRLPGLASFSPGRPRVFGRRPKTEKTA